MVDYRYDFFNDILKTHIPGFPKTNIVKKGFKNVSDPESREDVIILHLTSIQNKLGLLVDKYDFKRNPDARADFEVIKEAIDKLIEG